MHPNLQKSTSDDEDDLESLRLAALQSLKRPTASNSSMGNLSNSKVFNKKSNKRRFNPGRAVRNGTFNNRIRNATLITVRTIQSEDISKDINTNVDKLPKLVLPQDRYCNKVNTSIEEKLEASSKFDRYNNSDSDTDSESNDENSAPLKLERSNSLENLIQQLENEIKGDSKPNEEILQKPKKIKKTHKTKEETNIIQLPNNVGEKLTKSNEIVKEEPVKTWTKSVSKPFLKKHRTEDRITPNPLSPNTMYPNAQISMQATPYLCYNTPLCPIVSYEAPLQYNYPVAPPLICTNDLNSSQSMFVKYDKSLPSLNINTDVLNTISAPLSPRSAAFVLQNREIIERRKKSPRKSYSRSPSPRYRRSNSRSLSPIRRPSPKNRRTQAYKRSSPICVNRYNENSPKRTCKSPSRSTRSLSREKITNNVNERTPSLSLSPSPERFVTEEITDNLLDPILEARRKKFENDAVPTEGIIRLRPKSEENEVGSISSSKGNVNEINTSSTDEEITEDQLVGADDAIDFSIKMDDLFSDEESDDENEGRFKSKPNAPRVVPIKPFTQIANELSTINITESNKKQSDRNKNHRNKSYDREKHFERDWRVSRKSSRSPINRNISNSTRTEVDPEIKSLMSLKIENPRKKMNSPSTNARNEIITKHVEDQVEDNNIKDKKGSNTRKVEITNVVTDCTFEEDSDIDYDDLKNISNESSGDLRAQLSRKRAERQHILPNTEKISSRLLQNALQGVVFKKAKKSYKKKEKDLTAIDGKLPIHLRLGIPSGFNVGESKIKKKVSGKRSKSRAKYDQV